MVSIEKIAQKFLQLDEYLGILRSISKTSAGTPSGWTYDCQEVDRTLQISFKNHKRLNGRVNGS